MNGNFIVYSAVLLFHNFSFPVIQAKKLLSNIATLEMTVSRLEQETISLQFQLIQERNERRIAEFRLKQLPSSQILTDSPENSQIMVLFLTFKYVVVLMLLGINVIHKLYANTSVTC